MDDELVRKSEEAALDGELRSGDTTELKLSDYSESNSNRNAQHSKLSNSVPKKMKYEIEVNKNSPNTEEEEETEADFEDSTIHDKHMDLNVLKRKYGY